jgi:predicted ester cyclase
MRNTFFRMAVSILLLAACNNEKKPDEGIQEEKMADSAESKEEKNKETALASVKALIAGDAEATLKDVVADAVDYGDGSMPPVKSKDSLMVMLKSWRESLSDYKGDNLMALADGDYVAVFGEWTATFKADVMGMKTAGKTIKLNDADIFKFNSEGKITEHRNVQSSAEMMKQLGVSAPK